MTSRGSDLSMASAMDIWYRSGIRFGVCGDVGEMRSVGGGLALAAGRGGANGGCGACLLHSDSRAHVQAGPVGEGRHYAQSPIAGAVEGQVGAIDASRSAGPGVECGWGGLDGLIWRGTGEEEGLYLYLGILDRAAARLDEGEDDAVVSDGQVGGGEGDAGGVGWGGCWGGRKRGAAGTGDDRRRDQHERKQDWAGGICIGHVVRKRGT